MANTWERLEKAFDEGHRSIIRGYRDLIGQLEQRNFVAASQAASRLDTIAGPHIEFEEKYLYSQITKSRGDTYMSQLYDERDEAMSALCQTLRLPHRPAPDDQTVTVWIEQLRRGMDHASACGTMLSELRSLPDEAQMKFLDGLTRLRESGSRWSELHCQPDRKT